jgi:NtrC-family two-component system response regulator AlgB
MAYTVDLRVRRTKVAGSRTAFESFKMHAHTMNTVQKTSSAPGPADSRAAGGSGLLTLLIVGDEARSRRLLAFGLVDEGDVVICADSEAGLQSLPQPAEFGVALLDWEMKAAPAKLMMERLQQLDPDLPVVATVADELAARAARQAGVARHLLKPFSTEDLKALLKQTARARPAAILPAGNAEAEKTANAPGISNVKDIFDSRSQCMQKILNIALRVAPTSANVLILGENGTGKTALARGMHERSQRQRLPFVTVNCPCLQARLLESELFGHMRGSFTGAISDTPGKVAAAEGGTLFLDEIGELPLEIQPKLLRLLQDREYERVGEIKTRRANIRVIAATNRDLREEVKAGRFREDLFYRLNVITLDMPPLRRRPEDIVSLAEDFLRETAAAAGKERFPVIDDAVRRALITHRWPGNLRELRNAVERAAILSESGRIEARDFPLFAAPAAEDDIPKVGDFVSLQQLEEAHIREVMARTETLGHAAEILGINQATLYRKRKRLPGPSALAATPAA